jgi:hypothetical protein
MSDAPKPPKPRTRKIIVAFVVLVLVIVSTVSWWNWPYLDPRLIGKWQVVSGMHLKFDPDGKCEVQLRDGNRGMGFGVFWECQGRELHIHTLHHRGVERLQDEARQLYARWNGQPWFMFRFRIVETSPETVVAELVEGQLHGPDAFEPGGRITWKRLTE